MIQEHNIPFSALTLPPEEVYEAMGYGAEAPEEEIRVVVEEVIAHVSSFAIGRFMYFTVEGVLDKTTLRITQNTRQTEQSPQQKEPTLLNIGSIISKQLRGATSYALFVATAGEEFQAWMDKVKACDDMVLQYIADSLGSCLAERIADYMEQDLGRRLTPEGLKHTNRFSPGYCEWHVSEQHKLFSLFPVSSPCGVQLTDSSLMLPIKSVSGIIGIGAEVKKMEYSCGICTFERCYKKKRKAV